MTYDFSSLSFADFEDLSRDLIGQELGVRFEAFAAGPDEGIDGRHATGTEKSILQAKHYVNSRYANLKRTMKKERASIDTLAPIRYILTTSCNLTPANKAELAEIIGPSLQAESDIFGPGDLNSLLRRHPNITKSHIKLWLTGAEVLEHIIRAADQSFNNITHGEIAEKLRVYAPNPSFDDARKTLENHHVLIVSGPPGVGKTTLAEMLSYAHMAEDWDLVAIRGLDDGLTAISDNRKQIFLFDDFLGRVALDKNALGKMDSDLSRFITRVRRSKNARFILTTRAPIFEEAKRYSEHLADRQLDISRYLLDVGIYTRRIRARILYNHILVTGTPQSHINALIDSNNIAKIVDHKNYSPRLIALMTQGTRISDIPPEEYPSSFISALDNPTQLWDIPFRHHITQTCQHLLMTLFFCDQFGVQIEKLHAAYDQYHLELISFFGGHRDPKDFEESLRILEGGFIKIVGRTVNFVNPSVRDYLQMYLDDFTLLKLAAAASTRTEWAQAVWEHGKRMAKQWSEPMQPQRAELALGLLPIAKEFLQLPVRIRVKESYGIVYRSDGLSNVARVELLIDWWSATNEPKFLQYLEELVNKPVDGWDPWRDGDDLFEMIAKLRDGDYFDGLPDQAIIANVLENGALAMISSHSLSSEDIGKLSDVYDGWSNHLSDELGDALAAAVQNEFDDIDDVLRELDSESMVDEHIETLQKLAKRVGIATSIVDEVVVAGEERKWQIGEQSPVSQSPSVRNVERHPEDTFDDRALSNLFAPLRQT